MQRVVALLLVALQVVFVCLPGHGLVLCVGGHHGAGEVTRDAAHDGAPHDPADGAPVHPACPDEDCDGLHLTRGELEPWRADVAPPVAAPTWAELRPAPHVVLASAVDGQRRGSAPHPRGPGWAVPRPRAMLDVVRVACLRI